MPRRLKGKGHWGMPWEPLSIEAARDFVIQDAHNRNRVAEARTDDFIAADFATARLLDAIAGLAERNPAPQIAHVASGTWGFSELVALEGADLTPAEALTIPVPQSEALRAIIEFWKANPEHGVGVRTGAVGARFSLVAVAVDSWASWRQWLLDNAVDVRTKVRSKHGYAGGKRGAVKGETSTMRELRFLGQMTRIAWTRRLAEEGHRLPSHHHSTILDHDDLVELDDAAIDATPREIDRALRERLGMSIDRGGWLVWTLDRDERGKLATARGHSLGEGVRVLDDGDVIPLSLPTVGFDPRDHLAIESATTHSATFSRDGELPEWLANKFGIKRK